MSEWREVTLADLCERTTSGGTPSRRKPDFFCDPPAGTPWIKSQELVDRRIWGAVEHITEAGLRGSSAKVLPPNTVLIAMYGATVGQLGYLDVEASVNQAICGLVTDPGRTDSRFLYYALMHARADLVAHAHGAAQQNLSQARIRAFSLRVPADVEQQRQIAGVLTALDDLVENNRRRIELLEEMARAIYREWFVRFRYPGHEHGDLVDSAIGVIPDGWDTRPLEGVAIVDRSTVQPGRSPTETFWHYSIPAFDNGQLPARDQGGVIKSGKFLVTDPAVLVSKLNPRIERTWFVDPDRGFRSVASTEFLVLRPVSGFSLEYLYLLVRSAPFQERLRELSGGTSTSHQRAKPGDLLGMRVLSPPETLVTRLTEAVAPLLRLTKVLRDEGSRLTALRDLLLPRLLTGQIDVSGVDSDAAARSLA